MQGSRRIYANFPWHAILMTHTSLNINISPSDILGRAGNKKYLPPRHQDTKDFILLFVLNVWCLYGEKKKVLPQNAQNLQLKDLSAYFPIVSIENHLV